MLASLLLFLGLALADDRAAFDTWSIQSPRPIAKLDVSDGYRTTADVYDEVREAIAAHPDHVRVEQFGETIAKRPLWAFHVSDGGPVERKVLVFASIHALEWISTEVATSLLLELIANPEPGTLVTVIPILNPDGRMKVELDLAGGHNLFRRGNTKNVDLNRDFAVNREAKAFWKVFIPKYYATSPEPLSQPESRALDALAARQCYDRAASLHAFGGYLFWPWSGRWHRPEDKKDFRTLGKGMREAQGKKPFTSRQLSRWAFFFRAQGTEIDHLYGTYGTRAFLVELTGGGIPPFRKGTKKNPFRRYNAPDPSFHTEQGLEAMRALIEMPPTKGELQSASCEAPSRIP